MKTYIHECQNCGMYNLHTREDLRYSRFIGVYFFKCKSCSYSLYLYPEEVMEFDNK